MIRKLAITSLMLSGLLACAPKARNVEAPNNPLYEEVGERVNLTSELYFPEEAGLFTFVLLPENASPEKVWELTSIVAYNSTKLDDAFEDNDTLTKKANKLELKIESESERLEEKLIASLEKKYGCRVKEENDTEVCTDEDNDELEWRAPDFSLFGDGCAELTSEPFNRGEEVVAECEALKSQGEEENEQTIANIQHEADEVQKQIDALNFTNKLVVAATNVRDAVEEITEGDEVHESEYKYWHTTEINKSFIHPPKSEGELPKIQLTLTINNLKYPEYNEQLNRPLTYRSFSVYRTPSKIEGEGPRITKRPVDENSIEIKPDIIDVSLTTERNSPVVRFILKEKYAAPNGEEGHNGNYFELELKRYHMPFGHQYLGDVRKYNAAGEKLNDGFFKMVILPIKKN